MPKQKQQSRGTVSAKILQSNKENNAGKKTLKNITKIINTSNKNRIKNARNRQEKRIKSNKGFKYVSQKLASSVPAQQSLRTPFADVQLDLRYGKDDYDVMVSLPRPLKYEKNCKMIDRVVKPDKLKDLAIEIDSFLRTEYNNDYKGKSFSEILSKLLTDIKPSNFFNDPDNLRVNKHCKNVGKAKKAAASLSAALFICEPSKNRSFDGGKFERRSLKYIIENSKTFYDTYGAKNPCYIPAKKDGTDTVRLRSMGMLRNKEENQKFQESEVEMSTSSSSVFSESESSGEEKAAKQPKKLSQKEIKQYFKELMQQATDATLKFFVNSSQAEIEKRKEK